ncbi:2-haloacid dehalogenase [Anaerospora hongkongensis]|uniref:2-haloacid dehalogenase n=1 Tax=Anaerospora hongkongensis TaxID=244830 RepID=A0A4R1Q061_9FIRM|nr:haloacid dehalogenase type II [Anaerospora hongkongensis]TCL38826.1 2-haloacid dehalogenase [Anaerospora hongkongensis]
MKYKVITFDAYSALLDIKGSLVPALEKVFDVSGKDLTAVFAMWRTRQWDYVLLSSSMNKGFLSYRYITRCALDYTLLKFDLTCSEANREELVDAWSHLSAWPEAQTTLLEIKRRGYPIAILSNGDEAMLKSLEGSTGIVFDYIFCAEQAKAYKPSPKIYQLPFDKLGLARAEVLHVAGSPFDMMGAKAEGLLCIWSNRFHDFPIDPIYKPDFECNDLSGLLKVL